VELSGSRGDLESSLRGEYEMLLARVEAQREQSDRLRALADALEERTRRDEHLLEELAGALGLASQLRIEELSPRLRGQRLQEVAVEVLKTPEAQELHDDVRQRLQRHQATLEALLDSFSPQAASARATPAGVRIIGAERIALRALRDDPGRTARS
jgi:hypothetical protein